MAIVRIGRCKWTGIERHNPQQRPDIMSQTTAPAPWESRTAVFNILQTGTRKADCNPHELR
ncbi:hypothetical protein Hamer_G010006, partial [Homarus americanus]